ncbi:MAG: UDP-3-O-(3-hydroxymyristoyl)glucosamine N-acyltransferase, partial [Muribaculaceae bacterium]|nr:UDP-3-O-(3-hydroxymyristoyl)glucosamine N-acyltransferase [Muribaculaceae bacterium]
MRITPSIIASLIGGTVEGDAEAQITGFGPIESAGEGDITFLANIKYIHHLYTTKATAVLINEDFVPEKPVSSTLIRVKDSYSSLAELMSQFEAGRQHKAVVEQPCHISEGVVVPGDAYVGAFAY